jgi:hypothetical protein
VAKKTKVTLETESLDVVADRGYFNSEEMLACEETGITVTLPKGGGGGLAPLLDKRLPDLRHQPQPAQPARSDGSPDGNMSTFSKRCSAGSTNIRRRCTAARRLAWEPPFLMKTLPRVAAELRVLAYNLTCIMNIISVPPLLAAIRAGHSRIRRTPISCRRAAQDGSASAQQRFGKEVDPEFFGVLV